MAVPLRVGVRDRLLSDHAHSGEDKLSTQSSSLTQARKRIKILEEENESLRADNIDLRSAYKQLLTEGAHESFDERRVNWLKSLNIQLERQIILFQEALGARAACLVEVENSLCAIANCCRAHAEKQGGIGSVNVPRTDLQSMIETAESARIKLYKNIEKCEPEWRPLREGGRFVNGDATLADVCGGKTDHINLKHVAKLESQLSRTYKQLSSLGRSLQVISTPPTNQNKLGHGKKSVHGNIPHAVYDRLLGQVASSCNILEESASCLMELTVLTPAAPWPVLKRPILSEVTTERVMNRLPSLPRNKTRDVQQVIDGLVKALNYTAHLAKSQRSVWRVESEFHQAIYATQHQYVHNLITAIRNGYTSFEEEANEVLCEPLREVMRVFDSLQITASEDALRIFLSAFKKHSSQISQALEQLQVDNNSAEERRESLSEYGQQYLVKIDAISAEHQRKRDAAIEELEVVKQQQSDQLEELRRFFGVQGEGGENGMEQREEGRQTGRSEVGKRARDRKKEEIEKDPENLHRGANIGDGGPQNGKSGSKNVERGAQNVERPPWNIETSTEGYDNGVRVCDKVGETDSKAERPHSRQRTPTQSLNTPFTTPVLHNRLRATPTRNIPTPTRNTPTPTRFTPTPGLPQRKLTLKPLTRPASTDNQRPDSGQELVSQQESAQSQLLSGSELEEPYRSSDTDTSVKYWR